MQHSKRSKGLLSILVLALAFLALVVFVPRAEAQVLYGTIVGTVADPSGAAVPGVLVRITNSATGQTRETSTNAVGNYTFNNVLPGTYQLEAQAPGFRTYTQTGVRVTINTVARSDFRFELGEVTETITVEASPTPLQTDKTDVHLELASKEVTDLPLPNYRNYQSLINLAPGATPARFQNAIIDTPGRALTTHVNGTVRNSNNTRVDGATNIFPYLAHHTLYVSPAESIETVNVTTDSFDAEQGMAGGAAITVVTKSGTNEFHGSAFAFHTNNTLKAKNFFYLDEKKPKSIVNINGGTLGGPIVRNKLFFFGSWEGTRERLNFSRLQTLPTADQKEGDFNAYNTIYDPMTGNLDGSGRSPFPDNRVPLSRQSEITRTFQSWLPEPNQPGTANNFFNSGTQALNRDNVDVKINWNRTPAHSLWGKYTISDAQVECPPSLGRAGGRGLCSGGSGVGDTFVQSAALGHTWTLTPTFLIDGVFGYGRLGQQVLAPDYGTNIGLEELGIPGTNGPDVRQSGLPMFNASGYANMGNRDSWTPAFRNDNSFTWTTNMAWTKGRHDLRFGYDTNRYHINHFQPEVGGGPRGRFNFGRGITALPGESDSRVNAWAAYLLGLPGSMQKSLQYFAPMSTREWQLGFYARDRWQVSQALTMTLGLRYEYYPLVTRAWSGIERYDPETNQVLIGRFGGVPDNAGTEVSKKLFAPRVGLAYRLGSKMVIRSGYGITIDPDPIARLIRSPYPVVIAQDFLSPNSFQPFRPIEEGIPAFSGPDFSSGVIDIPGTVEDVFLPKGMFNRGYIQSWNFIIERELVADVVGTVGYVGTSTVHQLADRDLNAAAPGGGTAGRPFYPVFGRSVETNLLDGMLSANYHSLQTTLNRRFRNGLFLKGAYTFSKAINENDESGSDSGGTTLDWNHASVLSRNRAVAGYDRTHNLQLSTIYELPFGPGKSWATGGGWGTMLVRDWQINAVFSAFSGTPFTVGASGSSLNAPGNTQTADQVKGEVRKLGGIGSASPWLDPTTFVPVNEVRFGNSGRNLLRGPGAVNLDMGLFRSFSIGERFALQFRAEAFNLSNTPHFNNPSSSASDPDELFTITSAAADERVFRFALRLSF